MEYFSQAKQDEWVCEFFNFAENKYFVDIGAYDGIKISNTYALEKFLKWDGLCIEANPDIFKKLKENRRCACINVAMGDHDGMCKFKKDDLYGAIEDNGETSVELKTLRTLLTEYSIPQTIDYISIDVEGNEYSTLTQFPFNTHNFILMTVEHNLYSTGSRQKNLIKSLLNSKGYIVLKENVATVSCPHLPLEDWYINKSFVKDNI